jgi:hypothetical protein
MSAAMESPPPRAATSAWARRASLVVFALCAALFLFRKLDPSRLTDSRVDYATLARCATAHFDAIRLGAAPPPPTVACNYPPALYYLAKPLLDRAGPEEAAVWNGLVLLCTLACLALPLAILRTLPALRPSMPVVTLAAAGLLLVGQPFDHSVEVANPTALVGVLLLGAIAALLRGDGALPRAKALPRAIAAGAALGLASAAKLFPLALVLHLLASGAARRRLVPLAASATALLLFAAAQLAPATRAYLAFVLSPGRSSVPLLEMGSNSSILVLLHLLGLELSYGLFLAVFGGALILHLLLRPRHLAVELSSILVLSVLGFPVVWSHTYLLVLLPLLLLAASTAGRLGRDAPRSSTSRLRLLGVLYAAAVLAQSENLVFPGLGLAAPGAALAALAGVVLLALLLTDDVLLCSA